MELSVTHHVAAPIDRVWSLQLDHAAWPAHLPNFSHVERRSPDVPFGVGAVAAITQPALGTVDWTVVAFDEAADRRSFRWTGSSKGIHYVAGHLVEATPDGGTRLTLDLVATGVTVTLLGWMVKRRMTSAIEAEAVAFERWALEG